METLKEKIYEIIIKVPDTYSGLDRVVDYDAIAEAVVQFIANHRSEPPQDQLHPALENALNEMVRSSQTKKNLSKREVFAVAAMEGLLSNAPFVQATGHYNMDHRQIVTVSIGMADELLKQLEA
jgi:hypothetical protein